MDGLRWRKARRATDDDDAVAAQLTAVNCSQFDGNDGLEIGRLVQERCSCSLCKRWAATAINAFCTMRDAIDGMRAANV
jgi:hypothetical protein